MRQVFVFFFIFCTFSAFAKGRDPEDLCRGWQLHPSNPLITPPGPEWMIADPTFLPPSRSPDRRWHLFANSLAGLHHYLSDNGVTWERIQSLQYPGAARPYIYREGKTYFLYYEQFLSVVRSEIHVRQSVDLLRWSPPQRLLAPTFPWEQKTQATNGNPFLRKVGDVYALYFSAGSIFLRDAFYFEPLHIGIALGKTPLGPFAKRNTPILSPEPTAPFFNVGRGSLKVLKVPGYAGLIGIHNAMYIDDQRVTHSAIHLMQSTDGVAFQPLCNGPIIAPQGTGWMRAYTYAFDARVVGKQIWLFFNARSGWMVGKEQIGLAQFALPE